MVNYGGRQSAIGAWAVIQPVHKAVHIHGGHRGDVLEMGFQQTNVTRLAQPKGTYTLGKRALNSGTAPVKLATGWTGEVLMRYLSGLKLFLRWETQLADL